MERRKQRRLIKPGVADVFDSSKTFLFRAVIRDINEDAAAVICPKPLEIGVPLILNLLQSNRDQLEPSIIDLKGSVIKSDKEKKNWVVLIEFK